MQKPKSRHENTFIPAGTVAIKVGLVLTFHVNNESIGGMTTRHHTTTTSHQHHHHHQYKHRHQRQQQQCIHTYENAGCLGQDGCSQLFRLEGFAVLAARPSEGGLPLLDVRAGFPRILDTFADMLPNQRNKCWPGGYLSSANRRLQPPVSSPQHHR